MAEYGAAMHELPTGTVTFLFTDVEGSTRLLEELGPEAFAWVLAEHRRVVREVCASFAGVEVDTQGDAFFLAFAQAPDALGAAGLITERLGEGPVRLRMGVHTGTPLVTDEGYVGADLHRAARIAAAGHGGQVLVSASTATLVETPLRDLGEHRFKDLAAAERVFQLGESDFPPLRSLQRSNLPVPATPFLGRESELVEVVGLLRREDVRLVTLTGPGGTGKTRLALQAVAEVSDGYPDGVWWVSLAPLRDAALVISSVAQALEIREEPGRELVGTLASRLAGKRLLVLLDNAEHLLPGLAADVAGLVPACPTLTLVVTSRERLQIAAETAWPVPPLAPSDAEHLFVERARSAGVLLIVDETVVELCRRLDELPLALELAAARTVVFSPQQLLDRLAQRLDLLKGGRDADPRQQTLRVTIGWSHDLLDPDEQALFRRMSVFAGGCSYESAEQVAGADPDVLQSLLDKSLLRRRDSGGGPRFWMLETIREFAAEQLAATGEADDVQRSFLRHYAAVAEACFDETLHQGDDYERLEEERENLRLALDVALSTDPELALELGRRLVPSWNQRGEYREGRERLSAALARAPDTPTTARAWALRAAARLAYQQSDLGVADSLAFEALALFRELGHQRGAGSALNLLGGIAWDRGDDDEARRLYEEAVATLSGPGHEQFQLDALGFLADFVSFQEGDYAQRVTRQREIVASARREGSNARLAMVLHRLGFLEDLAGERKQARRSLEESIALNRQGVRKASLADALGSLGHLMQATAPDEALVHYSESLRLSREMEQPYGIAHCLQGGAAIFAARGNPVHATTLLGAASAIRTQTGIALYPDEQAEADTIEAQCRDTLPAEAFTRAWEEGAALGPTAAADWALQFWQETE